MARRGIHGCGSGRVNFPLQISFHSPDLPSGFRVGAGRAAGFHGSRVPSPLTGERPLPLEGEGQGGGYGGDLFS